jgi:hypothetical protein
VCKAGNSELMESIKRDTLMWMWIE